MKNIHILYFWRVWKTIFINISNYLELLKQLVYINLTQQFKKTILGNSWIIVEPLFVIFVWILLHSTGIFKPGDTSIPYPAYVLLSMSIWDFFIGFYKKLSNSVTASSSMLLDAYFPIEIKIVEKIIITIINFFIPLVFNIIILIVVGVSFNLETLLFIPALIPLALFGISLGLFFSLIEVVLNDLYLLFTQSLRLIMYLTPLVYSPKVDSPILQTIIKYNPLNYLISIPRDLLIGEEIINLHGFFISTS